jgi:hypothetical protein
MRASWGPRPRQECPLRAIPASRGLREHVQNCAAAGGGKPLTIFCIATYRKGDEFQHECKRQGGRVLLTEETLRDSGWPREAVDEFYSLRRDMPDAEVRRGLAHAGRTERIDRVVALDHWDVDLAAMLREYLQPPGMGISTALAFRDKLAMRTRARRSGGVRSSSTS